MAIKAKMSFDKARMKQFFVTHGEKIALAVVVLMSAYVAYGATSVENYNRTPKDLTTAVSQGRAALSNSHKNSMDLAKDDIKLPTKDEEFVQVIERELLNPLSAVFFAGIEWNRPLFETKLRRREPRYLAVTDLTPVFHHGAVEVKGAGGDRETAFQGEEWISVTGLVPIEEQTALYTAAFKNAIDSTTNATPTYKIFEIRRAEVSTMDPNEAVEWDKIQPLDLNAAIGNWIAKWKESGADPTPPKSISWPPLTEPLPPMPNKDNAGWSVHPTLAAESAAAAVPAPVPGAAAPLAPAPAGKIVVGPFGAGAAPAAPAAPPAQAAAPVPGGEAQHTKYLQFRFLDFDIEPGKRYRYQVKLVLNNPNLNLDQAHLEKPELAVGETREAPWSSPSPPVQYPYLEQMFAGNYKSSGGDLEPEVGVALKWWFPTLAAEGYVTFEKMLRGAILNGQVQISYFTPGKNEPTSVSSAFKSDILLVDFGWERTDLAQLAPGGRRIARPSEVLLVNPRGEMKIALQTMDAPLWAVQRQARGGAAAGGAVGPGGVGAPGGAAPPGTQPPAGASPPSIFNLK